MECSSFNFAKVLLIQLFRSIYIHRECTALQQRKIHSGITQSAREGLSCTTLHQSKTVILLDSHMEVTCSVVKNKMIFVYSGSFLAKGLLNTDSHATKESYLIFSGKLMTQASFLLLRIKQFRFGNSETINHYGKRLEMCQITLLDTFDHTLLHSLVCKWWSKKMR